MLSHANKANPMSEWLKNLCPPKSLPNARPTKWPSGKLRHKGAVGWSISGAMPPSWFASNATSAVESVTALGGHAKTTKPKAVIAAKSWVRAVITLL